MTGRDEFVLRTVEERGCGDPRTFQVLPWTPDSLVARMLCDVRQPDEAAFGGDSRATLRRLLEHASALGSDVRRRTIDYLEQMGIPVKASHHEVAQRLATHRGSGMHLHISLFRDGRSAFHQAEAEEPLSPAGRAFLAGVLAHAGELTAVTNQSINSHRRLATGFEAPGFISWTRRGAAALVRVPSRRPNRAQSTRFELRSPASELARETLGDRRCDVFVANKRRELDDERRTVTEFDHSRYLRLL